MYLGVYIDLFPLIPVEAFDDLLHLLGLAAVGHQQDVGRIHHHQVPNPQHGHQAALGTKVVVPAVDGQDIPLDYVAVLVLLADLPECRPGTHVVPAHVDGNDHTPVGVLHHCVVDGVRWTALEGLAVQADEIEILLRLFAGFAAARDHFRVLFLQLLEIGGGTEHEHAAVPEVVAGLEVHAGSGQVGFFHEAVDAEGFLVLLQGGSTLDVAVAGLGVFGQDAEGDQVSLFRQCFPALDGLLKSFEVLDDVIGRKYEHHRVFLVGAQVQRGYRGSRGGVPSHRLQQDVRFPVASFLQLLRHEEAMLLVADDHGIAFGNVRGTVAGLLQHGDLGDQGPELLGVGLA